MDFLNHLVSEINSVLWGVFCLIPLLCGTGIFYSIKLRFVQVRKFGLATRLLFGGATLFGKRADKTGMSSFQALATAIAAQVGTGNVAGTATAIVSGGPGALFWLWVAAFFGMATIFAEAVLAQTFKGKDANGHVVGGPAYYITKGMGEKWRPMAVFFSIAIIIALGCIGNMVQSNSISNAMHTAFGVPLVITGIVTAILAGAVFFGGVARLASVTEKIVPFMAAIYIIGGSYVIACHAGELGNAFRLIFVAAFDPQAVMGGALGLTVAKAMQFGVARGLFSNEAGMGSTPHAHAQANVKDPHEQGTVAMIGVFIDTFVVLTITALTVVITLYTKGGILADGTIPEAINKTNLAQTAFGTLLGEAGGNIFIAIALFFFAFSTVLGWNMFGKINVAYLFGKNAKSEKIATTVYTVISLIFIFLGTLASNDLVWELSDMFNQLMVIPNVIGLIACGGLVVSLTHFNKKKDQIKVVE